MREPVFNITKQEELSLLRIIQYKGADASEQLSTKVPDIISLPTVIECARENELDGLVAHIIMDHFGEGAVPPVLAKAHRLTDNRISMYLDTLDDISVKFNEAEIEVVALKNGGIVRGIDTCPGCSPMGDIDLLVRRSRFLEAHQILLDSGFILRFRSPLEADDISIAELVGSAEYYKDIEELGRFWLELQWRPIAGRWIRPDREPSGDILIDRSLPIEGTNARLLSPVDNLIQVSLHTAKHSYVRAPGLRLHLDVHRIVSHYPELDWERFLEDVRRIGACTAVYYSLVIPKQAFGTNIPDDVIRRLKPPSLKYIAIKHLLNKAGLFNPNERKFSRMNYILFNVLLYDHIIDLIRAILPPAFWMRERYNNASMLTLPVLYIRRVSDLLFRRASL